MAVLVVDADDGEAARPVASNGRTITASLSASGGGAGCADTGGCDGVVDEGEVEVLSLPSRAWRASARYQPMSRWEPEGAGRGGGGGGAGSTAVGPTAERAGCAIAVASASSTGSPDAAESPVKVRPVAIGVVEFDSDEMAGLRAALKALPLPLPPPLPVPSTLLWL